MSALFTPITLGTLTLPNRIVMGSMHTGLEDRARDADKLAAYLAERARGGAALIITGGYSPNMEGTLYPGAAKLSARRELARHRRVTDAVHDAGGRILCQLLHAGRYAVAPWAVSASATRSPITPFPARELSGKGIRRTIGAFVRAAELAVEAGYDGVEVMGSEGYLINQFLAPRTNHRTDGWGGTPEDRRRFAVEIVRGVRAAIGDAVLSYRISALDLVPDGQTWDEVVALAGEVEAAGASVLDVGIGWHEARVPTIVTSVPRAAFAEVAAGLRAAVGIPVIATNRINTPEVAESLVGAGAADLVSLARPFLADPDWARKAERGQSRLINTCIACNQACLDHAFAHKRASCLVNPRAGYETELVLSPVVRPLRVAVVGAGPAGLACAVSLAERGHRVELFEASSDIGGQFAIAMRIPGKEEFAETLRYYRERLGELGVVVRLEHRARAEDLVAFDEVVAATGVVPRVPAIPGVDHPMVMTYADLVLGRRVAGERVAVIGAGGIGVDVSVFLTAGRSGGIEGWRREWGVEVGGATRGGIVPAVAEPSPRRVVLLQRKTSSIGANLGRTTSWVHRATLRAKGVEQVTGVLAYERIDDDGLWIRVRGEDGDVVRRIEVDSIVLCAGQESVASLVDDLAALGCTAHMIGGAHIAAELDAKRAIREATELASRLG